jgi:hypothetical protein
MNAFDLLGVMVNVVNEFPGVILEMPEALSETVANAGARYDHGFSVSFCNNSRKNRFRPGLLPPGKPKEGRHEQETLCGR